MVVAWEKMKEKEMSKQEEKETEDLNLTKIEKMRVVIYFSMSCMRVSEGGIII